MNISNFYKIYFNKLNNNVNIIDTNNLLNENQIKSILKKKIKFKIIRRGDI